MKWQQTFTTPLLRAQDGLLPAMILGAVFIHGMAFYIIQASTPESSRKTVPVARLSILDPKKDHNLLDWIENHDPAAISGETESPQPPDLFAGKPYQPSFEKVLPEPLPITKDPGRLLHQSLFPPGPVPEMKTTAHLASQPLLNLSSQIARSPEIEFSRATVFRPPTAGGDLPTPARFLIAHASQTNETALFLLQSSGNDALDAYVRHWLRESQVALKNNAATGWVQIYWGNEIWGKTAP